MVSLLKLEGRQRRMRQLADRFQRLTAVFGIAAAALGVLGTEPGWRTLGLPLGLVAVVCALSALNNLGELQLWGGRHIKTNPVVFKTVVWLGAIPAFAGAGLGLVSAVSAAGILLR